MFRCGLPFRFISVVRCADNGESPPKRQRLFSSPSSASSRSPASPLRGLRDWLSSIPLSPRSSLIIRENARVVLSQSRTYQDSLLSRSSGPPVLPASGFQSISGLPGPPISQSVIGLSGSSIPQSTISLPVSPKPQSTISLSASSNSQSTKVVFGSSNPESTTGLFGSSNPASTTGLSGSSNPQSIIGLSDSPNPQSTVGLSGSLDPQSTTGLFGSSNPQSTTGLPGSSNSQSISAGLLVSDAYSDLLSAADNSVTDELTMDCAPRGKLPSKHVGANHRVIGHGGYRIKAKVPLDIFLGDSEAKYKRGGTDPITEYVERVALSVDPPFFVSRDKQIKDPVTFKCSTCSGDCNVTIQYRREDGRLCVSGSHGGCLLSVC